MTNKTSYLQVKDHSVSGECFELIYNDELEMLETFPRPESGKLESYYQSDDYISHTDYKRTPLELVYHFVKKIALKRKLRLIDGFNSESKKLLDVGCGTGDFLLTAMKNNWEVTGIEPNEKARVIANSKTQNKVYNIEHLVNLESNSFDCITLWHVLEHLPNLDDHIKLFKKLIKPNGFLVIAVPNFKSYDAKYYGEFWAAYDVPRHLWHFSRKTISKLFKNNGFNLEKIKPMIFDAFYVSLLSEKYKSGIMNPFKAIWVGLKSNRKARRSKEYSSLIYILKPQ